MSKHWSGQICPETGTYGQYHDTKRGIEIARRLRSGESIPSVCESVPGEDSFSFDQLGFRLR